MSSEIKVNKITTSSGSTLEFGGAGDTVSVGSGATVTGFGGGKVLQVVSTTKTDTFSASLGQAVPSGDVTGLTATITPSSTSNKILITAHICGSNSSNALLVWLYRDGSALSGATGDSASNRSSTTTVSVSQPSSNGAGSGALSSFNYFDSPATTSSITYSIRVGHTIGGTDNVYVNRTDADTDAVNYGRSISTITLMEIDA